MNVTYREVKARNIEVDDVIVADDRVSRVTGREQNGNSIYLETTGETLRRSLNEPVQLVMEES